MHTDASRRDHTSVGSIVPASPRVALTNAGLALANDHVALAKVQMSFLAWIVLGLLAGFIGSKIVNKQGEGMMLDIVLGIVGALAGRLAV